jgi:hypothetical protein
MAVLSAKSKKEIHPAFICADDLKYDKKIWCAPLNPEQLHFKL